MFMNEYDIKDALNHFGEDTPNLQRGAQILYRLMEWTNSNSDGWPYWSRPSQSARKLQELLTPVPFGRDREDATDAELKAALTPIKSFLTRRGVAHSEVFE